MCAQGDHPPYDDAPVPRAPRAYVLSGAAPLPPDEPRPSIALAVIGEMLNDAEHAVERSRDAKGRAELTLSIERDVLRRVRDRIAGSEGQL